jgi:hypothetical protein
VNAHFCSEAVVEVLRWFPTVTVWFDYTTTPPTVWMKDMANPGAIGAGGSFPPLWGGTPAAPVPNVAVVLSSSQEKEVSLAPQYERVLPGVVLCYKQTVVKQGVPWPQLYFDIAPAVASMTDPVFAGGPPKALYVPFVVAHTAEIPGASCSWVTSTPAVLSLGYDTGENAFAGSLEGLLAFWKEFDTTLADPSVDTRTGAGATLSFGAVSVTDTAGDPVAVNGVADEYGNYGYPNVLRPGGGQVFNWMLSQPAGVGLPAVKWVEANISVPVLFDKYRSPYVGSVGGSTVFPFSLASIACTGTTATAATSSPLPSVFAVGSSYTVSIQGASPGGYNGVVSVTVTGASAFTYTVASGTPASASVPGSVYAAPPTSVKRVLNHRVVLTNAQSVEYKAVSASDTGEGIPPCTPVGATSPTTGSLAQLLYDCLSVLQHAGSIPFVGTEARGDIGVGNTLSVRGPNTTYTNLLVQGVVVKPHTGDVSVRVGPASRLDAPMLIELWRMTRRRTLYNMPSGRKSGQAAASGGSDGTGAVPKENTIHGLPDVSRMSGG